MTKMNPEGQEDVLLFSLSLSLSLQCYTGAVWRVKFSPPRFNSIPPVPLTVGSVLVQEDILTYGIITGSFFMLKPAVISNFGDVLESTCL